MRRLFLHGFFVLLVIPLAIARPLPAAQEGAAPAKPADAPRETVALKRGKFEIRWLAPHDSRARAVIVLGSGDGGWSYWEERVLQHLGKTCAVIGVDFSKYADTDYDQATLAADFSIFVSLAKSRLGDKAAGEIPVILGGWSMGAEQAVAACGLTKVRPEKIAGLLLVAPGARGRYGLRLRDRAGLAPNGEGTFGLADFAEQLRGIKLAQFHARYDLLDSDDWAEGLAIDLRRFDLPRGFHDFEGAGTDFLKLMDDALDWILAVKAVEPSRESKAP